MHPILRLRELGQSVWLDYLDRALLASGELDRMIERDGLAGLTSNPTIFQRAIAASTDYDTTIRSAAPDAGDAAVFEEIQVHDVGAACDHFRALYDRTDGRDGFASIEVAPQLAHDAAASVEAARRLWSRIARPNLMVKIPGTREGVEAIERCLTEGININVTLLFSVERYEEVATAYLRALEARAARGAPVERLASVASFFVSRVDAKVDRALDHVSGPGRERAAALRGRVAVANAKIAYDRYGRLLSTDRWARAAARGARPQRLLWASTSPKDPAYPALRYAEALIGPDTIDTMTPETFRTYLEHGLPEARLASERGRARADFGELAGLGIDFERVTRELEDEGVAAFAASFDRAVAAIASKRGTAAERRPANAASAPT